MAMGKNLVFLTLRAAAVTSGTTTSTEQDLGPYINVGKRSVVGVWCAFPDSTCTTDGSFDNKFQESATTVDSDFADITGADFTAITGESTPATECLTFVVTKRYLRSYATIAGTTAAFKDLTGVIVESRYDS